MADGAHNVLVLGLGVGGMAAARLLRRHNAAVTAVDAADTPALHQTAAALRAEGCVVDLGVSALPDGSFDLCIVSPGLAADSPWLRTVIARGIPVISELAFGVRHLRTRLLAVTGSNGKSTLVKLCAEALNRAGLRACPAGNYGYSVCQVALDGVEYDWVVVEVSSFQLEFSEGIRPDVAVLLNVLPNHLDRHGDMATYRSLKFRIFNALGDGDVGIMPPELLQQFAPASATAKCLTFGDTAPADFVYHPGRVTGPDGADILNISGTLFDNPVLGITAAAAAAAMQACGVDGHFLEVAVREFEPLPHRMESVGCVGGIRFINDSKATNLAAMCAALRSLPGPIRLIAGGLGKGESFDPAAALLREKVVGVYLIGQAASALAEAWSNVVDCRICGTLDAACIAAWNDAAPGDTILLSPACASFDQFRNFEERGRQFREWTIKQADAAVS
jgi:UDP-N-acetylmuramoylalanine--D-glutamate ligase